MRGGPIRKLHFALVGSSNLGKPLLFTIIGSQKPGLEFSLPIAYNTEAMRYSVYKYLGFDVFSECHCVGCED